MMQVHLSSAKRYLKCGWFTGMCSFAAFLWYHIFSDFMHWKWG